MIAIIDVVYHAWRMPPASAYSLYRRPGACEIIIETAGIGIEYPWPLVGVRVHIESHSSQFSYCHSCAFGPPLWPAKFITL